MKISGASAVARIPLRICLLPQLSESLFPDLDFFTLLVPAYLRECSQNAKSERTASVTAVTQRACIIYKVGILFQLAAFTFRKVDHYFARASVLREYIYIYICVGIYKYMSTEDRTLPSVYPDCESGHSTSSNLIEPMNFPRALALPGDIE